MSSKKKKEPHRDDYSLKVSALPAAPAPEEEAAKRIEELPLFAKEEKK